MGSPKRISASLKWWLNTPNLEANDWVVIYSLPPNTVNQRLLSSSLSAEYTPAIGTIGRDLSPQQKPILSIRIPVVDERLKRGVVTEARYTVQLAPRRLVAGAGADIGSLTANERALYLDASGMLDYNSIEFQHWLASESLKRRANERDLDFAWRAFARIRQLYTYHYDSNQDRHVSKLCQTNNTDCGGLSLIFASALRANQIPARTLFGRKMVSDSAPSDVRTSYGSDHVIAEFFKQEVGWIPVDMAAAVSHKDGDSLRYFGCDAGDLVTLHIDPVFKLDSMLFGQQIVDYLQSPHFWVTGRGTVDPWSANVLWRVRKD